MFRGDIAKYLRESAIDFCVTVYVRTRPTEILENYDRSFRYCQEAPGRRPAKNYDRTLPEAVGRKVALRRTIESQVTLELVLVKFTSDCFRGGISV